MGFISGILETIGITAIIPLFSFVLKDKTGGTDIISTTFTKFFGFINIQLNFYVLAAFIILLFIAKSIVLLWANNINAKITANFEKQMRVDMFRSVLNTNWTFLSGQKIGYLEKIVMDHIARTSEMLRHLSGTILLITNLLIYIFIALNISSIITLLTLSIGCILFLFYKPIAHKTRKISQYYADNNKIVANIINENMIGIKTIKATASENKVWEKVKKHFNELQFARVRMSVLSYIAIAFLQPIIIIFIIILFAFSYTRPDFNLASFVVIIYLIQKIFSYIQNIQGKLQTIYESLPYLKSVVDNKKIIRHNKEITDGNEVFDFQKEITFKKISFFYSPEKGIVLNDVNFTIKKGESVRLVGPSGAGKTTIVDLLLRLFEPNSGEILIDGKNINTINVKKWREVIGYVSQDIFLLNDSIENNIRFYDDSLSNEIVIKATKMANIYDFIETLPEKLSTQVGERGVKLSAGQRQRIILARVLARSPKILILDEATSSLDNESEVQVQNAIKNLKGKITVLAIAHRLATVMNSDTLLALENGKIIEQGEPENLLRDKNSYFYKVFHIRDNGDAINHK